VEKIGRIVRAAVCLAVLATAAASNAQVSVSDTGQASYSVPIPVPPGIGGVEPKIQLRYSGGGQTGPFPFGWSIGGLSVIMRCGASPATDGVRGGVTYTASDKLCLDGQRLIVTNAAGTPITAQAGYGLPGSEYRTERDVFTRVRAYGGSSSTGPDYLKAWTKSGLVYEFGATANSRILVQDRSVVAAWALNRVTDTVGNFMTVSYYRWANSFSGSVGSEWAVHQIRYTGNGSQAAANKVEFSYEARPDQTEAFHQGAKTVNTQRLSAVRTWTGTAADGSGGVKVSTLKLAYTTSPTTARSLLASVQICGGAAETTCLPQTGFTYSPGSGLNYQTISHPSLTGMALRQLDGNRGVLQGDFNGDGRQDLFRWSSSPNENELMLSNGDGSFTMPTFSNLKSTIFGHSKGCYQSYIADFNADGVSDILHTVNPYAHADCSGFSSAPARIYLGSTAGAFAGPYEVNIPLLKIGPTYTLSCVATSGEECTAWETIPHRSGRNFHMGDFNSDGIPDILVANTPNAVVNPQTACSEITCIFLGSASAVGTYSKISTSLANENLFVPVNTYKPIFMGGYTGDRVYIDDLNGDGLSDIFLRHLGVRYLANGSTGNYVKATGAALACGDGAEILDANGDGKLDIACLEYSQTTATPYKLWLNDGLGNYVEKGGVAGWVGGAPTECGTLDAPVACTDSIIDTFKGRVIYVAADFDGDGISDILGIGRASYAVIGHPNALAKGQRNGTFTVVPTVFDSLPLGLNYEHDALVGNFTGSGAMDVLRISNDPGSNVLFTRAAALPPDLLVNVRASTGALTTINYKQLADPTVYTRLADATYPVIDLVTSQWVIWSVDQPNGVGGIAPTSYKYMGQRAQLDGRGYLGFKTIETTSLGADGTAITTRTTNRQDFPFTGLPAETRRWVQTQGDLAWMSLSTSTYADLHSLGCPVNVPAGTPRIFRPVLQATVEETRDLNLVPIAKVTTTNGNYNCYADPQQVSVKTEGDVKGTPVAYNNVSIHQYSPAITAGDSWILGRLARSDVTSTVPNMVLATNTGSAPLTFNGLTLSVSPSGPTVSRSSPGIVTTTVTATAAGGYPGYTYSWVRVSGSLLSVDATGIGTFKITGSLTWNQSVTERFRFDVTDASGAVRSVEVPVTFTVGAPPPLVVSQPPNLWTGVKGAGTLYLSTSVSVNGGAGSYTYAWSKVVPGRSAAQYDNTPNQTIYASVGWSEEFTDQWQVTVSDGVSAPVTKQFTTRFTSAPPLSVSLSPAPALNVDPGCGGGPGTVQITATVAGGVPGYSLTWTSDPPYSSFLSITPNGSYTALLTGYLGNVGLFYTTTATDSLGNTASAQSYIAVSSYPCY
jgi:hypothetical protein